MRCSVHFRFVDVEDAHAVKFWKLRNYLDGDHDEIDRHFCWVESSQCPADSEPALCSEKQSE